MKLNRITAMLALSSLPFLGQAASYEVVTLPTEAVSSSQFASSIDNTGLILTTVRQPFNPPIDLSIIDLDQLTLTDPDAAAQGDFNDIDYTIIVNRILGLSASFDPLSQKLSSQIGYQTDGADFEYVFGFDSQTDETDGFTFSQTALLTDSVGGTHIVGIMAGPYVKIPYTLEDGTDIVTVTNEFNTRAFVQVGDTVTALLPANTDAGGLSDARAINNNFQVAGEGSVAVSTAVTNAIASCNDEELRGDQPLETCLYSLINRTTTSVFGVTSNSFVPQLTRRAMVWQLNGAGEVVDTTVYGLTFEPDADDENIYSNRAVDINDNGVAVGSSPIRNEDNFFQAAAVFENGVASQLISDPDLLPNFATSINNSDIVVGYIVENISGTAREKMFVYDRNSDQITQPVGFFVSSETIPRAINNDNIVVGEADVDSEDRRKNAFIYDIDADTFTNLNSLIACDAPYEIVAANDINDMGEIIAEALVTRPQRDIRGESISDADGNVITGDTVIAVKLVPTGNAPADCAPSEEEVVATERQGASFGILSAIGLMMLVLFRRFKVA